MDRGLGCRLQVLVMAHCDIIPIAPKACSGKCKSGGCAPEPTVWVLAACGGMATLLSKQPDGQLKPLNANQSGTASLVDGVRDQLTKAAQCGAFNQLVLVGSANDIAWTQASLPADVSKHIVAEIEYPLVAGWFSQTDRTKLAQALDHLFDA